MISKRLRLFLAALGGFLLLAPFWIPAAPELNGRNVPMSKDSLMILGASLWIMLLFPFVVPNALLTGARKFAGFVRRFFIPFAILFLGVLLFSLYLVNQKILHAFMNSADEHSCYFLAECLRMGKWWIVPPPLSEFFNVVHVGNRDGKWFSVYPPGWPALMAVALQWNVLDWLNPVLTILAVIFLFLAAKKVYGWTVSWVGIALVSVTPYFLFTGASYFSHSTCLLMIGIFYFAMLKWEESTEESKKIFWISVAGVAAGYGLATRYLTMLAFIAPFILHHIYLLIRRREKWSKSHTVFTAILVVSMALILSHNYIVTGKITKAPNRYDKRWERLGFRDDYTILDGLIFIVARYFYLIDWTAPVLTVVFILSLFQKRKMSPTQQIFRWAFFYPVIAYFFYFSWGGNQFGPRYYYEGYPFLIFTALDSLRYGWREGSVQAKKIALAVVLVALITPVFPFLKFAKYFETVSRERKALYVLAESTIEKPALVFIKGFLGDTLVMSEDDAVRNSPRLNAKVLYAHDMGEKNQLLRNLYPQREAYRGSFDRTAKQARLEKI